MYVRDIKRYLRAGYSPERIPSARFLSSGACKDAYVIGNFVVKEYCDKLSRKSNRPCITGYWSNSTRKVRQYFQRLSVSRIQRWFVKDPHNQWWVIQPLVTPIEGDIPVIGWQLRGSVVDLHNGNLCHTETGKLVAFDW